MDSLDDIYKRKFGNTEEITSLGWGSTTSQEIRFLMLMDINGFKSGDSVLDVGCGHGDLSYYINNYTGVDIREHAIKVANKKFQKAKFIHGSMSDINNNFDWIFASGIFCFKSDNWHRETNKLLMEMYNKSNKGVAVNFLSNLSDGNRDPEMMYASISDVFMAIDGITKKFNIRHDYRPNDCTVYLYK
jgi:ubiquinone/menaquinone biosynthesis C-methylase UbiE